MKSHIPHILIYTKVPCPYCERAKAFFKARGLAFEEIDLSGRQDELDALKKKTGHMTVPQIYIDDLFVGGYSDLIEKVKSGEVLLD